MSHVEVTNLSASFKQGGRRGTPFQVLDRVSLSVEEGQFVCVLGPSGCGKSTLLNVLAGLVTPDEGSVEVHGSGTGPPTIGYCFQSPRLLNWRTVRQNLAFALHAHRVPASEHDDRIDHYLRLVGLEASADQFPLRLSGGMQQRVAIARALALEPDILLMDEPFSALDELTARGMRIELLRIWEQHRRTVFFVTHNAHESAFLADRIAIMGPRPAYVRSFRKVDIARPRSYESPAVLDLYRDVVGELLQEGDADRPPNTPAGRPGRDRMPASPSPVSS